MKWSDRATTRFTQISELSISFCLFLLSFLVLSLSSFLTHVFLCLKSWLTRRFLRQQVVVNNHWHFERAITLSETGVATSHSKVWLISFGCRWDWMQGSFVSKLFDQQTNTLVLYLKHETFNSLQKCVKTNFSKLIKINWIKLVKLN